MNPDLKFLENAIQTGLAGMEKGGGPFGAVIARNGTIISSSGNRVVESADPTAHAEILAIRAAAQISGTHDLSDCVLYSSCEPCPMCLGAIYWAGIKKVVYASSSHDAGKAGFSDQLIYNELTLAPSDRIINFVHLEVPEAHELFNRWALLENKRSY
jgi:tRNA(Arg) A34 adenosine deaminase TadA